MLQLGSKGFYGLLAVADLAQEWVRRQPIQVRDIARRQGIPEDYLGQIMVALRKGNIVDGHRGPGGGYVLARNPDRITVAQVIEALEGPHTPKRLLGKRGKAVPSEVAKNILRIYQDAVEASLKILESTPVSTLLAKNGREQMFYI